jgi:hypothetical protein
VGVRGWLSTVADVAVAVAVRRGTVRSEASQLKGMASTLLLGLEAAWLRSDATRLGDAGTCDVQRFGFVGAGRST